MRGDEEGRVGRQGWKGRFQPDESGEVLPCQPSIGVSRGLRGLGRGLTMKLVGSSSINMSVWTIKAVASLTRDLHPPDKAEYGPSTISGLKPKPFMIARTWVSDVSISSCTLSRSSVASRGETHHLKVMSELF